MKRAANRALGVGFRGDYRLGDGAARDRGARDARARCRRPRVFGAVQDSVPSGDGRSARW